MLLDQAQQLAEKVLASMRPFAERAEIAGSIRRRKAEVKDIEIVAIPRFGQARDLFGLDPENLLFNWAQQIEREDRIHWIKPGTSEIIRWPLKEQGRYWRGLLVKAEIKLDLFLTTKETWGATYLIRTGSSEFNVRIVGEIARQTGHQFTDGKLLDRNWQPVSTPEEMDVFRALGIPYVEPENRI